jgi:hypothetical protein
MSIMRKPQLVSVSHPVYLHAVVSVDWRGKKNPSRSWHPTTPVEVEVDRNYSVRSKLPYILDLIKVVFINFNYAYKKDINI